MERLSKMKRHILCFVILLSFLVVGCKSSQFAVHDNVGLLSQEEINNLEQIIKTYEESTSNEIEIIIINSLKGEKIEDYANRMHNLLKVGKLKYFNGILIVYVKQEKKVRLNVARGLINSLTNERCQYILDNYMIPRLKEAKYFLGFKETIDEIKKYAKSDWKG